MTEYIIDRVVLFSDSGIEIDQEDLDTLNPGIWLNDRVIQLFFNQLRLSSPHPDIHIMDTLFYPLLREHGSCHIT